jgi:hypothetical protein
MDKNKKSKNQKVQRTANVLESLKDIGGSTKNQLKDEVFKKAPQDFMDHLFGPRPRRNYSGEIIAGEAVEIKDVYTGKQQEKEKLQKQIAFERRLRREEEARIEKRSNELKIQLNVLLKEVYELSQKTQELGEESKLAAIQAPVEPGVYHVIFFEKLIEFIKSFRKKIDEAVVWLHANNKRAEKKNYWAKYKKHGGKFLLSADHYLTRSAG